MEGQSRWCTNDEAWAKNEEFRNQGDNKVSFAEQIEKMKRQLDQQREQVEAAVVSVDDQGSKKADQTNLANKI